MLKVPLSALVKRIIADLRVFFREYGWLLLSHHPRCPPFSGRTLRLGKLELCRGCVLGYTSAMAALLVATVSPFKQAAITYFIMALVAGGLAALRLLASCRFLVWLADICRGLGLAWGILAVFTSQTALYGFVFGIILATFATAYIFLRFKLLHRKCRDCSYYDRIPQCPGLSAPGRDA
jgi:hypothetical protein